MTLIICYLSRGLVLRSSLVGWFRVSYEVVVGMILEPQSSEGWTGAAGGGHLRWPLTWLASRFLSCRLSTGLPSTLLAWWLLPPEQAIQETEAEVVVPFMT